MKTSACIYHISLDTFTLATNNTLATKFTTNLDNTKKIAITQ
jgi:hypothetical protein